MQKVKLGVIGASSKIALEYHLPALARCDGVVLESACDLNLDRLNEVKSQFGFNKIQLIMLIYWLMLKLTLWLF